jgi:hypothetical protein
MSQSKPPVIRVIISKETPEKVMTKVVVAPEVGEWKKLGWSFVCYDPMDEEKVARWFLLGGAKE